ncbi:Putative oxidoreductase [hydrothermal vent metagenome]|uniref:Oxidoreductase n=1 Tax=hydrothermal vent metagenome TaxID=652676 RepID=A0A3B0YF87_9ZZZZ
MKIPDNWKARNDLLDKRIILITGAASGIGAATAKRCAAVGATIILLDKTVAGLEAIYDAIESAGGAQPAIYPMNLEGASEKDYLELAATIEREFGQLDGLLHNAAMLGALVPMAHFESELWYKILQVNLNAPFMMTRACLELLMKSDAASVVFNSDKVGREGKAYWGAYSVSKAGIENLMEILADEMESNTRVRFNSYDPGPVATALRAIAYPGEEPGKASLPEDVVEPLLYLLSEDSRESTGKPFSL